MVVTPIRRRLLRALRWLALAGVLAAQLVSSAAAPTAAMASKPKALPGLTLGFNDDELLDSFDPADIAVGMAHAVGTGASVWRFAVEWNTVSPTQPPSLTDAADPNWSGYDWSATDATVREIAAAGMTPLITLGDAPAWAEGPDRPSTSVAPAGTWDPSAAWFGAFATALAQRYSGSFVDASESATPLPAVRDWEAWNEPNLSVYLTPQWTSADKPASPGIYRGLLNAFYKGVKSVTPTDVVAAGTTAPFGDPPGGQRMRPVLFWRELLCLTPTGSHPRSTHCHQHVYFNAISHHPYPLGPPTTHAADPGDVSVPDLGEITRLIPIAERAGTVRPKGPKPLWITEISWDSNPPNPNGLSPALQAEYLEGALYVLWKQGASLIAWWNLRDDVSTPGWVSTLASGVYYAGATPSQDTPKPSYTAYSFPFTAYRTKGVAALWGMAPVAGPVAIQVERGSTWTTVLTLQAQANRIFSGSLFVGVGTNLRAVSGTSTSLTWTAF
ncbi:MAG: hypothetical protein ABSG64_08775 [Solirubrobacteraceae bacterium]